VRSLFYNDGDQREKRLALLQGLAELAGIKDEKAKKKSMVESFWLS
jgi:hypothetical protein